VSLTTNSVLGAGTTTTASAGGDKDFWDMIGGVLPSVAQTVAGEVGIDPRVAGQTVSQVLSIFGIGGPGKAFQAAVPREQAVTQLKQIVGPHLSDPVFAAALQKWLQAAMEPVQAHQQGKAYQPSVELDKGWFDSITDAFSSVPWNTVAKIGMQALPLMLSIA
jgi:hypothetical protein